MGGQKLDGWETLVAGLGVGLLAHAAPVAAAALLIVVLAVLFRGHADVSAEMDFAPLAALGAVAFASLIGGPHATIGAALVWRAGVELHARGEAGCDAPVADRLHLWSAPAAALFYKLDAPTLLVVAALCVAGVAWADWLIRRLADWRLDAPTADAATRFLGAQAAVLTPLLIFPAPQTCLAALVAMGAARAVRWDAPARFAYATAR